jgi:CubicO group peptidase (beta-lactamase class C family)
MRSNRLSAAAILVAALAAPSLAAQNNPLAGFDGYVEQSLKLWRVPGIAIAVVRADSIVLLRGYGVRQVGRTEPVTPRTMFEIGSTTKAFSSAILAMLVDDGKLGWDDPVIRHLPWFALKDPWVTREVTLRDLLSHRVGVGGDFNALLTSTRTEIIRRTRFLDPNIGFRTRYDYSNMMYATAGEVAAAVAGKPWEVLLRERVLDPLGMRQTTTDISRFFDSTRFAHCFYCPFPKDPVSIDQAIGRQDVAMPHMLVADTVRTIPWQSYDNGVSAGSVISNVTEMAEWLRFLLGQGTYRGRPLIRPETFRELHKPQSIITPAGWLGMVAELSPTTHFWAYGLGWRMNDYRGRKIVWHTGGIAGFLAYVGLVPEEKLGIVALSNGDLGYELLPQSLALRLIDGVIGGAPRDWSAELAGAMKAEARRSEEARAREAAGRVPGTRPSLPLEKFAGRYANDVFGEIEVGLQGQRLILHIPAGAEGVLRHWHYDVFRLELDASSKGDFFTTFRIGPAGQVDGMVIEGMGEFRRVRS